MKKLIITTISIFGLICSLNAQNVGIGTSDPEAKLHVLNGDTSIFVRNFIVDAIGLEIDMANGISTNDRAIDFSVRGINSIGLHGRSVGDNSTVAKFQNLGSTGIGVHSTSFIAGKFDGDFIVNDTDFFVDKSKGKIGLGTSYPLSNLHIIHGSFTGSGVSQGLRIDSDFGTTDDNWWNIHTQGASGDLLFYSGNDATTGDLKFVMEDDGDFGIGNNSNPTADLHITGTTSASSKWATNSTEFLLSLSQLESSLGTTSQTKFGLRTDNNTRMLIDAAGNIGIGSNSPLSKFHILHNESSGINQGLRIDNSFDPGVDHNWWNIHVQASTGDLQFYGGESATTATQHFVIGNSGLVGIRESNPSFSLDVGGIIRCIGLIETSDLRFKKNVQPLSNIVPKLEHINGYEYSFRTEEFPEKNFDTERQIGVIAQEIEKVFPELVSTDTEGYKSVNYSNLTAVLLEAIKEQQVLIDTLQKENAQLRNNDAAIEARMAMIESLLEVSQKSNPKSK